MRTNKFLGMIAMLVLSMVATFFVSCGGSDGISGSGNGSGIGDDDGINVKSVIGTWTCTSSSDFTGGEPVVGYMVGQSITIYENGKFSSTASSIGSGTWTLDGKTITAKNSSGDTFSVTLIVNGNTMKWSGTSSKGVRFNYTWMKKSSGSSLPDTNLPTGGVNLPTGGVNLSVSKLVGTWEGSITQGITPTNTRVYTFGAVVTINADGTYKEVSDPGYRNFSGTWKDNGNGTITLTGFFDPTFRFSLNGNTMTLTGNSNWTGRFTRKY